MGLEMTSHALVGGEVVRFSATQVAVTPEQDERPEVNYKPVIAITVGLRACIIPVNHYSSAWVTNGNLAWTGTVLAHDATTGAFETARTRYVLDKGYEH